jgi:1,4-dihydroxy-6-naphthoate synthase
MKHAQEMDWNVAQDHISLYVYSFSYNLGEEGYHAIETLLERALAENLIPAVDFTSLLIK